MDKVLIEFTCPFCTKQVRAGIDFLMHQTPQCKEFEELEPDDFMVQANNKLLGKELADKIREVVSGSKDTIH